MAINHNLFVFWQLVHVLAQLVNRNIDCAGQITHVL
ncbi:Uncharacterised protein [Vibrio cholerae]|nr:Uncharacterised protein [Vibrio cholerae]